MQNLLEAISGLLSLVWTQAFGNAEGHVGCRVGSEGRGIARTGLHVIDHPIQAIGGEGEGRNRDNGRGNGVRASPSGLHIASAFQITPSPCTAQHWRGHWRGGHGIPRSGLASRSGQVRKPEARIMSTISITTANVHLP